MHFYLGSSLYRSKWVKVAITLYRALLPEQQSTQQSRRESWGLNELESSEGPVCGVRLGTVAQIKRLPPLEAVCTEVVDGEMGRRVS